MLGEMEMRSSPPASAQIDSPLRSELQTQARNCIHLIPGIAQTSLMHLRRQKERNGEILDRCPFHNEEENVTILYARLKQVMEQVDESFELILVDDGSSDRTFKLLEEVAAVDSASSSSSFAALRPDFRAGCGFDHASGEFVLAWTGLQHDPNDIPAFIENSMRAMTSSPGGAKCASTLHLSSRSSAAPTGSWRGSPGFHPRFRHHVQGLSPRSHPEHSSYGEMHRFIPALASLYGASICEIPIRNLNRVRGKSHYGLAGRSRSSLT